MALKKITKITNKQIAEKGVQALSDRPNLTAQYGASGLSATQLKLWFDKLATFLADRINEITNTLSGDDATSYIRVCLDEYGIDNLGDLINAFTNGDFAAKALRVYSSASARDLENLQSVLNGIAKSISDNTEALDRHRKNESGLKILYGTHGQPTFYAKDGHLYVRIIKGSVNPYRIENGMLMMRIVKEVT